MILFNQFTQIPWNKLSNNWRLLSSQRLAEIQILYSYNWELPGCIQGRVKGGQLPRDLRSKGAPRDDIYLF